MFSKEGMLKQSSGLKGGFRASCNCRVCLVFVFFPTFSAHTAGMFTVPGLGTVGEAQGHSLIHLLWLLKSGVCMKPCFSLVSQQ